MLDYRVYVIGEDGHFSHRYEFYCATDDEAKVRARQLMNGRDVELWQLGRMVESFSASGRDPLATS